MPGMNEDIERLTKIQEQVLDYPHFEKDDEDNIIDKSGRLSEYVRQAQIDLAVEQEQQKEVDKLKEAIETLKTNYEYLKNLDWKDGMEVYERPDWDEYFLSVLPIIGQRATCNRGRSGCLITSQDHRILMSGYVGAPPGMPHCDDVGHEFEWRLDYDPFGGRGIDLEDMHRHCIRTIHAEANTIYCAARMGVALEGATMYCTMTPCRRCAEAIVQSGIVRVVTAKKYHDSGPTIEYFQQGGVELITVGDLADYKA